MIKLTVTLADVKDGEVVIKLYPTISTQKLVDDLCRYWGISAQGRVIYLMRYGTLLPLKGTRTLAENGVQDNSLLVVDVQRQLVSYDPSTPIVKIDYEFVFLAEHNTGKRFHIRWHPAVIGRQDKMDPDHMKSLCVDLSEVDKNLMISRRHAAILLYQDRYFICSINPRNPTFLNQKQIAFKESVPLQIGDTIRMGQLFFEFQIIR